jgi:hypothetical protein
MSVERVTITALYYGQTIQNVLNFDNPDGGMTPTAICQEIANNWIGVGAGIGIKTWATNSIQWVQVACQTMQNVLPAPTTLSINIPGQQTADNQQYPMLCIILKFSTAIAGRKGRGRSYCPGVSIGYTTNGLVNAQFEAYAGTSIVGLDARYKINGGGPLVLLVGPKSGRNLVDYQHVTKIQHSTFVGVQRRRNIGYGV